MIVNLWYAGVAGSRDGIGADPQQHWSRAGRGVTFQTVVTFMVNRLILDILHQFHFQAQSDGSKPLGAHGKDVLYDTPGFLR